MINKKITAYICALAMSLSVFYPVYAETVVDESTKTTIETAPYTLPSDSDDVEEEDTAEKTLNFNAESAVTYGLENNKTISILENKIQLAIVSSKVASSNADDLADAEDLLQDAASEIFDAKQDIDDYVDYYEAYGVEVDASDLYDALDEAQTILDSSQSEFEDALYNASYTLDNKISYSSLITLDADDAGDLMIKMAGVNLDITKYAKGIYRNQIAMLIKKNYYDALYAEKMYELKKTAKERGEKQYNMVKLSYENGMKAKDDLLLSKMYYDGTVISCRLAESTYKNAIFELKENMNVDMDTEIILEDSMINEVIEENLADGLTSGLTNRIEIQQALGQLGIYILNKELLNSNPEYKTEVNGKTEAKLLVEGAELQLDKAKTTVKSEINQSYETMVAAGEMLEASNELIKNAEEVVSIANLKYEQGFGAENALLKQMDLQDSSGTILELIAAQEKLSDVEAQVAQISYGYTMAKVKYYNDAGILVY
jgi:outer membrane protein TolC